MECSHQYYLHNVLGYTTREEKVDLEFGSIYGEAVELFYRRIMEEGDTHDAAVRAAVRLVLGRTWDTERNVPTLGEYVDGWRCLGLTKFKNEKGNPAKCPFSHKGKYFPMPSPGFCGCGSKTAVERLWLPATDVKDRIQLVRAIVWYAEEVKNGALKPISVKYPDGSHKAAVEVQYRIPFATIGGIKYHVAGWFDGVKQLWGDGPQTHPGEGEVFITDYKTTKNQLNDQYFSQFAPNVQVDLYGLVAGRALPADMPYSGVAIEAMQAGNGWVKFGWRVYPHSEERKEEFYKEILIWLSMAQQFAIQNFWPRNRTACRFCNFKEVCKAEPSIREAMLNAKFERSRWNPLLRKREPVNVGSEASPVVQETQPMVVRGD